MYTVPLIKIRKRNKYMKSGKRHRKIKGKKSIGATRIM